jgi:hypothetical protein
MAVEPRHHASGNRHHDQAVAALGIGEGQLAAVELQAQAAGSQLDVWERNLCQSSGVNAYKHFFS